MPISKNLEKADHLVDPISTSHCRKKAHYPATVRFERIYQQRVDSRASAAALILTEILASI